MKNFYKTIFIVILTFFSVGAHAQLITNGDFESWIPSPIFTLDPEGWVTENLEVNPAVTPDSMAYQGDFAMKVKAMETGVGAFGAAYQTIDIAYIPEALYFYAKWDKTFTAGVGITVVFYNGESEVATYFWSPTVNQSGWTPIILSMDQIEPIITHVTISVYASVGDFIAGTAWISIDEMSLGTIDGVAEVKPEAIQIGPNPCDQYLNVHFNDQKSQTVSIIDMYGNVVIQSKDNAAIDVSLLSNGQYVLQTVKDGRLLEEKFIVQH